MSSNCDRAERWMYRAFDEDLRNLAPSGNVYAEHDTIFSYGRHFPMAIIMRERPANAERHWRTAETAPTEGRPQWVLVNGDSYSTSTSGHQSMVRTVIAKHGLPSIIVPFTALNAAGIDRTSIEVLEVRPDRTEVTDCTLDGSPTGEKVQRWNHELGQYETPDPKRRYRSDRDQTICTYNSEDCKWHYERRRHWLGDSLFIAKSQGRRRRFLSSFDHQEARALYFLCELPRSSKAETVEQAYEDLKPPQVKAAEAQLRTVSRQGDMFAVPTTFTTREIKSMTPHGKGRIVKRPKRGVLGTNHTASEIVFATKGRVYARGTLYHQPGGFRAPDHARRRMGDGKTWHLLVKNTVPQTKRGDER